MLDCKKLLKLLKFFIYWAMLMSAINLFNFNVLRKRWPTVSFSPQKTKYKCQEEEKVETENSL